MSEQELTPAEIAAYDLVDKMVAQASGNLNGGPAWNGWALREAFLAGVKMGAAQEREACAKLAEEQTARSVAI